MNLIVLGSKFFLECLKSCLNLVCLAFFLVIFFLFWMMLTLIVMPMTLSFIKHVKTLMLLMKLWECRPKSYLNNLKIIKWKAIQTGWIDSIWDEAQESQVISELQIHWPIKYKWCPHIKTSQFAVQINRLVSIWGQR